MIYIPHVREEICQRDRPAEVKIRSARTYFSLYTSLWKRKFFSGNMASTLSYRKNTTLNAHGISKRTGWQEQ